MKPSQATILVLIDLVQDFDVLFPVLNELRRDARWKLRLCVSNWLRRRAPRIPTLLAGSGIQFRYVSRGSLLRGWSPGLKGVDALLTGAETTAGPHRWSHALALRANAFGIPTFTLQHGLDNVAAMAASPERRIEVGSNVFFCWSPENGLPETLPPQTRAKIVSVGRPMASAPNLTPSFDVGFFENLHAPTYTDDERRSVIDRFVGLVQARPDLRFYARSHPAGAWMDRFAGRLQGLSNLNFVNSAMARSELENALAAASASARIITTPSTMALDAAMADRRVALALDGGDLFGPLPVLHSLAQWLDFSTASLDNNTLEMAFIERHVKPGDAVQQICRHLAASQGI